MLCGELGIRKGEFFEVALEGVETVSRNLETQVPTDSLSTEHYTPSAVAPVEAWANVVYQSDFCPLAGYSLQSKNS